MKKKVLVIDDDYDILEPLSILLEIDNYEVETTPKGEETIHKVNDFKPDVILLDMLLSGSDGRQIARALKSNVKTKDIAIIMMSAHPSASEDAKLCGADDFIAKPFESEDLLTLVKSYISQ
jgi:DNA-binding response OmpR family regulator